MSRPTDLPHAALTDLVQHDVVAHDQSFGLSLVDCLSLILGELAGAVKQFGEVLTTVRFIRLWQLSEYRVDLPRRHESAVGKPLNKLIENERHGFTSRQGNTLTGAMQAGSTSQIVCD